MRLELPPLRLPTKPRIALGGFGVAVVGRRAKIVIRPLELRFDVLIRVFFFSRHAMCSFLFSLETRFE